MSVTPPRPDRSAAPEPGSSRHVTRTCPSQERQVLAQDARRAASASTWRAATRRDAPSSARTRRCRTAAPVRAPRRRATLRRAGSPRERRRRHRRSRGALACGTMTASTPSARISAGRRHRSTRSACPSPAPRRTSAASLPTSDGNTTRSKADSTRRRRAGSPAKRRRSPRPSARACARELRLELTLAGDDAAARRARDRRSAAPPRRGTDCPSTASGA